MNLKASNKYLFDQTVDCHNCKHISTDEYANLVCLLNPVKFEDNIQLRGHFTIRIVRNLGHNAFDQIVKPIFTYSCGPLGVYFEPKSE